MRKKINQKMNLKRLPDIQSDLYKRDGEPHLINLFYIILRIHYVSDSKFMLFSAGLLKVLGSFRHVY